MSFFCFGGRWLWIRKPALRNVPVARFNRRGFRRNGSESTTGRVGTHVAVRPWAAITNHGRHAPNPQERQVSTRPIRRKERSFDDEIYQHGPFVTIYCRLRRYPVGAHSVRPDSAKSYGSWANNVRPYGSAGADEFTNGVPRSYPRAPSLAALPRQSEFTTGRAGRHVAVRPWAAIANHGRHTPNPKAKQALRFHHLTKPKHML